jgi:hypothetical protein
MPLKTQVEQRLDKLAFCLPGAPGRSGMIFGVMPQVAPLTKGSQMFGAHVVLVVLVAVNRIGLTQMGYR